MRTEEEHVSRSAISSNRGFQALWASQAVSSLGSQVTTFIMPSLAVLVLHASALQVGILVALNRICYPILAMPVGVWVDRVLRLPLMVRCNLAQASVLLCVPVAYLLHALTLAVLYVVATVAGVFGMVFDITYRTYVPEIVPTELLMAGNSRLAATDTAAQVAGPGLAGFLMGVFRPPLLILLDVASFLFSASVLRLIPRATGQPTPAADNFAAEPSAVAPDRTAFRQQVVEGLRFVATHPKLRLLTSYTGIANLGNSVIASVFLIFAYRVANLSPAMVGLVMGMGSVGAFGGTFLARPTERRLGIGRTMIFASLFGAIGRFMLVVTVAGATVPLIALSWLIFGLSLSVYNVSMSTVSQTVVPAALRGRVNAVSRIVIGGTLPLGALLGGFLADSISPLWAIFIGCIIRFLGIRIIARSEIWRIGSVGDLRAAEVT